MPKDRSLKSWNVLVYLKILRAMYQLRKENQYVIGWSLLSKSTALSEGAVCDASMELRENGFFDNETQELGRVTLTAKQFKRGLLWSFFALLGVFVKQLVNWLKSHRLVTFFLILISVLIDALVGGVVDKLFGSYIDNLISNFLPD